MFVQNSIYLAQIHIFLKSVLTLTPGMFSGYLFYSVRMYTEKEFTAERVGIAKTSLLMQIVYLKNSCDELQCKSINLICHYLISDKIPSKEYRLGGPCALKSSFAVQ